MPNTNIAIASITNIKVTVSKVNLCSLTTATKPTSDMTRAMMDSVRSISSNDTKGKVKLSDYLFNLNVDYLVVELVPVRLTNLNFYDVLH